ncbi:MAG: hypothetical protein V3R25_10295 [Nitrosomonadaceae bacterium]
MSLKKTKLQKFWTGQIEKSRQDEKNYRQNGAEIVKRYRSDGDKLGSQFNILRSNTDILKSATFSRVPQPNVTRRFKDANQDREKLANQTAELLERCLEYYSGEDDFIAGIRNARDDMLLPGRGVCWVQYNAEFEDIELDVMEQMDIDGDGEEYAIEVTMLDGVEVDREFERNGHPFVRQKLSEDVEIHYVNWEDYFQSNSRDWATTWWVARRHGMVKDKLINMFGEKVLDKIDMTTAAQKDSVGNKRDVFNVYEIWDKIHKQRIWFSDTGKDLLETEDAPLELEGFFPCPKPLYAGRTTDSMVPISEFSLYQDQARELDRIVLRLTKLTEVLKYRGVRSADSNNEFDVAALEDGEFSPVSLAQMQMGGGTKLADQFEAMPIEEPAKVIMMMEERKALIKNEIYELTGIADIMRGAQDPSETATASRLKGSFGSIRLRTRREPIEEFIRDLFGIMAEIISNEFSVETIQMITGIEVPPEVHEFMQDDTLRDFRISVETDSTVQPNQEIDKRNAVEFLTSTGAFMTQMLPLVQAEPRLMPLIGEMMKFGARNFKAGRQMEDELDKAVELMSQPQQQEQKPDLEGQAKMMDAQNKGQKIATDAQLGQMKLVQDREDNQVDLTKAQIKARTEIEKETIKERISAADNKADIVKNVLDVEAARGN